MVHICLLLLLFSCSEGDPKSDQDIVSRGKAQRIETGTKAPAPPRAHPKAKSDFPFEFQFAHRPALDESEKPPLLIALHGYGANEASLHKLTSQLDKRMVIVTARAPYRHANQQFFWFNIDIVEKKRKYNMLMGAESLRRIGVFIDQMVEEHKADPNQVYLMGFSQGAMLAHAAAVSFPEKIKGIMVCSGSLYPDVDKLIKPNADYSGIEAFISHGTADRVFPINHAERMKKFCDEIKMPYTFKHYGGVGHGILQDNSDDMASWITEQIGPVQASN